MNTEYEISPLKNGHFKRSFFSAVSTTLQLKFVCSLYPPIPLCAIHSTLIAFPPVLLLSREALSGITSAVTQSLSNDLNMTSGLQCLHTDKAPRAFVSALSAASVYDPKDTQRDELHWPLPHPRAPGSHCLYAQCMPQMAA